MRNEVEKPMRENCETDDQRRRPTVVAKPALSGVEWLPAADRLINECCDYRPNHGRDQTVRVGVKIRVEHAACREAFDDAQLLNPEQNQCRPDVIEKLHRHEQNPERDFVSFRSARKSNAVMSDKHFRFNCRGVRRGERL